MPYYNSLDHIASFFDERPGAEDRRRRASIRRAARTAAEALHPQPSEPDTPESSQGIRLDFSSYVGTIKQAYSEGKTIDEAIEIAHQARNR